MGLLWAGDDPKDVEKDVWGYLQDGLQGMVSRARCLVGYNTRWALFLFVLAMGGSTDVMGWVGWQFSWGRRSALLQGPPDRAALQPVFSYKLVWVICV